MWVSEFGPFVKVDDASTLELDVVAPVDAADMALHIVDHFVPIVLHLFRDLPAALPLVFLDFAHLRREMHQLFRDAAHVHARPADPPGGAVRRGSHEIAQRDLGFGVDCFTLLRTGEASRSAPSVITSVGLPITITSKS